MRHTLLAAVLVASMLSSVGCAFGTRTVHLPEVKHPPVASGVAKESPTVVVAFPVDNRGRTDSVGCVRNGFYMRTAEVVADNDVCTWVQDCLAASLGQHGYRVTKAGAGEVAPAAGQVVVRPAVGTVFCDSYFRYTARVELSASLLAGGESAELGLFTGSSAAMNWAGRAASYQENLERAMRDCLRTVVPALEQQIRSKGRTP